MSTVGEVAMVMEDMINEGDYTMAQVIIELGALHVSDPLPAGMQKALDPEGETKICRKAAGSRWQDVLLLLVYQHVQGLMQSGYFLS